MQKPLLFREDVFFFLALVLASSALSIIFYWLLKPMFLAHLLCFLFLLGYIFPVIPALLKVVEAFRRNVSTKL
jgi:hypothetical protein